MKNPLPPPDVIEAFDELAWKQRDEPEDAMNDVAMFHSGSLSYILEHVGDLTNRIAKRSHIENRMGQDYVRNKTRDALKTLKNTYGFRSIHLEQCKNNAKHRGIPYSEYMDELTRLQKAYGKAHSKLKVYNPAQYAAREAAVALGNEEYEEAVRFLEALNKLSKDKNRYEKVAFSYKRNPDGSLVEM